VLLIRYTTTLYSLLVLGGNGGENLTWIDGFLNSLAYTMQTFTLDLDYTQSIALTRELFMYMFGSALLAHFFGVFAALANVSAPVMGGAVLLGILTSAFPKMRLWVNQCREKYVFSEMNERAVCLAEDIVKHTDKDKKRPLIVFTDVYVDSDSEESSELLQRARIIGAVCVKDDLLNVTFNKSSKLTYLLMDEDDSENIHTLTKLLTDSDALWKSGRKRKQEVNEPLARFYVFSQKRELSSIIKGIYEQDKKSDNPKLYGSETDPETGGLIPITVVKIVQEFTSIAYNLLNDIPLFRPLMVKSKEKETLTLTIVGGGRIGKEVFLAAYWYGQMLNVKLHVNVITQEDSFKKAIDYINPEIFQSGVLNNQTNESLLRVCLHSDECAEPYASFALFTCDVGCGGLDKLFNDADSKALLKSDYFVVALGTDELDVTIATDLSKRVQLEKMSGNICAENRPVIAYSIYDTALNRALNGYAENSAEVNLYEFAALKDIYSYKNIFMDHINPSALNRAHNNDSMLTFLNDEYKSWSSAARAFHFRYKLYSSGVLDDCGGIAFYEIDWDMVEARYWNLVKENEEMRNRLTWLEHRRWNAYMRTNGFVCPTLEQWENYARVLTGSRVCDHKHLELKLHPFLVEGKESFSIKDSDWNDENYRENRELDNLDLASIMVYQKKKRKYQDDPRDNPEERNMYGITRGKDEKQWQDDYKIWDSPERDVVK
jgi:hypothetical protein